MGDETVKYNGIIIRSDLGSNPSWLKRVTHWHLSFQEYYFETKIISVQSQKHRQFVCGTETVLFLNIFKPPSLLNYFLSPFTILLFLLKERPDFVLLAHGGFLEFYTVPIYCKFFKIPLLVDTADIIGRQLKKNKTLIDHAIIFNKKLFDKFILKSAYEIFTISTELENIYKCLFPTKRIVRSIPSTVNIELFKDIALLGTSFFKNECFSIFDDKEVIKIFYAGTITRLNGIEFFLQALSKVLLNQTLNLKLIFAIIDGNTNELKALVKKHNLDEYLIIIPPVEQKYLPILLSRADILFIPEQGFETSNAGFPGKTSEYLLSGRPVITTNFSDLAYYLKNCENACITEIGDVTSYSQLLEKLISNSKFRDEIGKNGKLTAINLFSHHNCAKPYIKSVYSYYRDFKN